ncbi:MAG: hypothetical protein HC858_06445 [Brachymonas sp.]|nr:hypothetical protein [Brachymonas sp.]NJS36177.1 hypothetical protein [Brachymonas sp.]
MKRMAFYLTLGFVGLIAHSSVFAQTFYQYGAQCAKEVTPIPAFSCMAGEKIPITINGQITTSFTATCDKPSLLKATDAGAQGQCVPGSRALVLRDDAKAQISAICRKHVVREPDSPLFDEINIVSHNLTNGKTCWFTAKAAIPYQADRGINGARLVPSPSGLPSAAVSSKAPRGYELIHPASETLQPNWRDAWRVEKTTLPNPAAVWMSPETLVKREPACTTCHDSGPFMYSPYIAQTTQLPGDPFGKYQPRAIGQAFKVWPQPFALTTRGNTCTTCHRMGNMNSCAVASLQATGRKPQEGGNAWSQEFPQSHWMSPGNLHSRLQWDQAFIKSLNEIVDCCNNSNAAQCQKISYEAMTASPNKRLSKSK